MTPNRLKSLLFMIGWAFCFVAAMSLNKGIDKTIPTAVIVFYRISFALIGLLPVILYEGKKLFKTNILYLHVIRAALVAIATWCTYYVYRNLPFAVATSIGMSGPLFTSLMAVIFLKEQLNYKKGLIIIFGYIGVLIVVFPHCVDLTSISSQAVGVSLFGNLIMGGILVLLKRITKEDSTQTILFFNTLFVTLIYALYASTELTHVPNNTLYLLVAIGLLGLSLQFFYAKAMKYEAASFVAPLEYLRVLISIPVGYIFFSEPITIEMIIGSILIIGSTYQLSKVT